MTNFKPKGKYNLTPCWTVNGQEFKSLVEAKRHGANQFLFQEIDELAKSTRVFNDEEFQAIWFIIEQNPASLFKILSEWSALMPVVEDTQHDEAVLHGSLSPEAAEEAVSFAEHLHDMETNR